MSVVGHSPPPFFKRGPAPLARLMFFVALSFALLVLDLRFHYLETAREAVATVLYPVQRAAYTPAELLSAAGRYFTTLTTLERENAELRRKSIETAIAMLRQQHLDEENQRLRALLDMKRRTPVSGAVAQVLYAESDPFSRRVIIDRGLRQGIVAGQAVVDELGVIGQVTRVFPLTSEVTLVTDKNQAEPVQIMRNGLRAVLFGAGAGRMELRYLSPNADVRDGDILVTSGLDDVYLPGLPVAKVVKVNRDPAYAFATITCVPLGGVEMHNLVLVLGLRARPVAAPPPASSPAETKKQRHRPRKGRR